MIVERERHGRVEVLRINRPEARNAVSPEVAHAMEAALDDIETDDDAWAVVVTGTGDVFSAGADLKLVAQGRGNELATHRGGFGGIVNRDYPKPLIAAVNGPALAGGFALALLCDLRIAGRTASFGYPELPRGIPPSYAAARAVLPATVAQELCLTGRIVDAREAQRLGIVREVVTGSVVERAMTVATRIAALPRAAVLETKQRTLLERRHLWGFLFEEEARVLHDTVLGDRPEPDGEAA